MKNYDWIDEYRGKPFRALAYGPDAFDCYGLVWHVAKFRGGIEYPRFDDIQYLAARINAEISGQALSGDWELIEGRPQEYDVVVMRKAGESHHVGIWLDVDGGKVLHMTRADGVLVMDMRTVRRMGYQNNSFHRYQGARA